MDARQLPLDFLRGMVEHVPLRGNGTVSAEVMRAVLLAVYAIPGESGGTAGSACWAGQRAIAAWAGRRLRAEIAEDTARRALRALEDLQVLVSYRARPRGAKSRATLNHYVIVWGEIAGLSQQGVTKPSPTKATPASKPGQAEDLGRVGMDAGPVNCPVDRSNCPVDRSNCPVDRSNCPVDPATRSIPARAPDFLIPTGSRELTSSASQSFPEDWEAVAAELRWVGINTATQRAAECRARGWTAGQALAEIRRLWRIAQGNARRFRSGPAAALGWRLKTGDWPCDVDESAAERPAGQVPAERLHGGRLYAIVTAGRRERLDDTAIRGRLVAAGLPQEFLETEGW